MTDAEKLARYEAALRQLYNAAQYASDHTTTVSGRAELRIALTVAREALAAAQEGDRP